MLESVPHPECRRAGYVHSLVRSVPVNNHEGKIHFEKLRRGMTSRHSRQSSIIHVSFFFYFFLLQFTVHINFPWLTWFSQRVLIAKLFFFFFLIQFTFHLNFSPLNFVFALSNNCKSIYELANTPRPQPRVCTL